MSPRKTEMNLLAKELKDYLVFPKKSKSTQNMKKIRLSLVTALVVVITSLLAVHNTGNTYSTSPPVNRCGLYGTQPTCTACHAPSGTNDATNSITIAGNPVGYVAGQTYSITVSATAGAKYGFQLACVTQNGNTNAGTLANITNGGTGISSGSISGNIISFISHNTVNTSGTWTFNWTAPTSNVGNVVFYLATNSTNASNTTSGDKVKTLTLVLPFDCSNTVATISPSNATVCPGASQLFTASGGGTYAWNNGATTSSINVSQAGNYTVTVTAANGCTSSATAVLQAASNPTATISSGGEICQGGQTTLSASGGIAYSWSTGQTTANITVSPTMTTTYAVTVTNQTLCTATATTTVTVNPNSAPTVTATNAYICAGQCGIITAVSSITPATYIWSTGATTAIITQCPPNIGATPYTVTVTTSSGCSASYSTFIQVFNNSTATINETNPICAGNSATLQATGGGNYLWNNGANTSMITVSPTTTTTYTVTVSNTNTCSATASRTVVVNPLPTPVISGANSICTGGSTTLTTNGGGTYLWSNGTTAASITVTPTTNTTYTVTVTSNAGCSATAQTNVSVSSMVATATNAYICQGICTTLAATANVQAIAYQWSNGATSQAINVCPLNIGTNPYTVTVTGSGGCTATYSTFVQVGTTPSVTISPATSICAGTSTTLSAQSNTNATYQWNNGATTASTSVSPTTNTTYTVTVTSVEGCTTTATTTVSVSNMVLNIGNVTQPVCNSGGTLGAFTTGGITPYTRAWSNGATTISITNLVPGTYTVTVTDAANCSAVASAILTNQTLATPTNLTTTNISNTSATLQWSAVTGAATYTVQGRKVGTTTWTTLAPTTSTSRTVNNLQACKNYQWRVRANCSDGTTTSAMSASVSFTTTGCGAAGKTNDEEMLTQAIELFPNPAANAVNLYYESSQATTAQVYITDLSGKVVYQNRYDLSEGINTLAIDLSQLPTSYYIVQFSSNGQNYYERLIVE
jgi:hypothetical protein